MTMVPLTLTISDEDGSWRLAGELTFAFLSREYNLLARQFPTQGKWVLNCKALTRVDTSGAAFLLSCIRHANRLSLDLKIVSIHTPLVNLMKAQGVWELFTPYLEKVI